MKLWAVPPEPVSQISEDALPVREPTVGLVLFKLSVPPVIVRLPVWAPKAAELPNCRAAPLIVVPPV